MRVRLWGWLLVAALVGGGCSTARRAVDPGADQGAAADAAPAPDGPVPDGPAPDWPAPHADAAPPDQGPPLVVKTVWPWDGALTVPCDTEVTAWFAAAVDPTSVSAKRFTVSTAAGPAAGTLRVWKEVVSFKPTERLRPMVPHTVLLRAGIRALNGRVLTKDRSWTFTCDRAWGKDATLATGPKSDLYQPLAAIDGNGDGHAVWQAATSGQWGQLWHSRRDAGAGAWSAAQKIHDKASSHHLLEDGQGDIWLVWVEGLLQSKSTAYARRYEHLKKAWQPVTQATLPGMASGKTAAVASADGVSLAVYSYGAPGGTPSVQVLGYSRKAGAWSKPEAVASGAAGLGGVEIACDGTGAKLLVGWYRHGSTAKPSLGLQARHRGLSSATWSTPELLVPGAGALYTDRARLLHMDIKGNAHVIIPPHLAGAGFEARSLDAKTGSWGAAVVISPLGLSTQPPLTEMNRASGHLLVGYLASGVKPSIWAVAHDPAKKAWLGARKVADQAGGIFELAVDRDGNGLFLARDEDMKDKVHRLYARTGKWETAVNMTGPQGVDYAMVSGAAGEALLVGLSTSRDAVLARWFR